MFSTTDFITSATRATTQDLEPVVKVFSIFMLLHSKLLFVGYRIKKHFPTLAYLKDLAKPNPEGYPVEWTLPNRWILEQVCFSSNRY